MVSEGQGHRDPASLTSFNLIRPMTALSVLVSRNTFHPRHQTEGCSLKCTERSVQLRHTQQGLLMRIQPLTVHTTSLCEQCGGVKWRECQSGRINTSTAKRLPVCFWFPHHCWWAGFVISLLMDNNASLKLIIIYVLVSKSAAAYYNEYMLQITSYSHLKYAHCEKAFRIKQLQELTGHLEPLSLTSECLAPPL